MNSLIPDYWKQIPLQEMNSEQWEALCDGCCKCCLYRLEDADTREIYFTNVHCRLLDTENCSCSDYPNRSTRVEDCITITMKELADPYWLPVTCAYRLLAEGKDLPSWHPLVSGDAATVVESGNGICGRTVCEDDAGVLEHHLIEWVK